MSKHIGKERSVTNTSRRAQGDDNTVRTRDIHASRYRFSQIALHVLWSSPARLSNGQGCPAVSSPRPRRQGDRCMAEGPTFIGSQRGFCQFESSMEGVAPRIIRERPAWSLQGRDCDAGSGTCTRKRCSCSSQPFSWRNPLTYIHIRTTKHALLTFVISPSLLLLAAGFRLVRGPTTSSCSPPCP